MNCKIQAGRHGTDTKGMILPLFQFYLEWSPVEFLLFLRPWGSSLSSNVIEMKLKNLRFGMINIFSFSHKNNVCKLCSEIADTYQNETEEEVDM